MTPRFMTCFWGIFFANMGVGVVEIVFTLSQEFSGNPLAPGSNLRTYPYFIYTAAVQMGAVPRGFPFLKALKPGRHNSTNGGRTAVQIEGVLQYSSDKLYQLGAPEHFPLRIDLPPPVSADFPRHSGRGKWILTKDACFSQHQERKSSPKSKFWGRISRRRPRGYPGGRPGAKTSVRPSKSWKEKNKHFGADIHDSEAQTSMTPERFLKKSGQKNFRLSLRSHIVRREMRNARLCFGGFVRNFWRVCSQFWLSVRNSI